MLYVFMLSIPYFGWQMSTLSNRLPTLPLVGKVALPYANNVISVSLAHSLHTYGAFLFLLVILLHLVLIFSNQYYFGVHLMKR